MTTPLFIEACRFATLKHAKMKRKSANHTVVPYIVHPLEAAQILTECGITDEKILIAAVLHDVLEDTDATKDDIRFKFGSDVLNVVSEVTDPPNMDRAEQKAHQINTAHWKCYEAKLVKTADKTSNLRDLIRCPPGWPLEKVRAYTEHAKDVVAKLNSGNDLPLKLTAAFWQAYQEVLAWCAESEFRNQAR